MADYNAFGFGALFAGLIVLAILIVIAVYAYVALAWYSIAKKRKYPNPWLAWIPFANIAMIFELGGFHWAWVFLVLLSVIPLVGSIPLLVLLVIANWRIFESLKYPGWLSLALAIGIIPVIGFLGAIAYLIIIGIIAWSSNKSIEQIKKSPTKKKR